MNAQITINNIGGITEPTKIILKKGLNIIKAPNASVKTSIIKALQTLILPERILKHRPEFLNNYSNEGSVEIMIEGKSIKRKLMESHIGSELKIVGRPLYNAELGMEANLISFAEPENEFLNDIIERKNWGETLHKFVNKIANIKYYEKLQEDTDTKYQNEWDKIVKIFNKSSQMYAEHTWIPLNRQINLKEITNNFIKLECAVVGCKKTKTSYIIDSEMNTLKIANARMNVLKKEHISYKKKLMNLHISGRNNFNKKIMEVFKLLDFKNFEKIELDDTYNIKITRKFEGKTIIQNFNRLSSTEKLTVGIILMLALQEEYLPDFPFFVLDQITTNYDSKNLIKLINYIQKYVPYTIVTTFSSTGEKIQVEYGKKTK